MFISSSKTTFWKRSQAKSSFSMIFVGIFSQGWDKAGAVVLGREVLDVTIGVDESTSKIWTDDWDEGRLDLTTWDDPCLAFLPQRLGRLPKSRFFGKVFLLSPVDGRVWGWTSRRLPSPTTSFPLFSFIVDIPKTSNNYNDKQNRVKRYEMRNIVYSNG